MTKQKWVFLYDGYCGMCVWLACWLSKLDLFHQIAWTPYQSLEEPPKGLSWSDLNQSAYLATGRGRLYEGYFALRMLSLKILPLVPIAPILWLPGAGLIGVRVYRWIARNRYRLSRCRPSR